MNSFIQHVNERGSQNNSNGETGHDFDDPLDASLILGGFGEVGKDDGARGAEQTAEENNEDAENF